MTTIITDMVADVWEILYYASLTVFGLAVCLVGLFFVMRLIQRVLGVSSNPGSSSGSDDSLKRSQRVNNRWGSPGSYAKNYYD